MHLAGLDCATQPRKTGLALASLAGGRLTVYEARVAASREDTARRLAAWLGGSPAAVLALDAPLGWPAPMAEALSDHAAGRPLAPSPDAMFHRRTDRAVWEATGKKPLEVGAGWLARTAHAALASLGDVRQRLAVEMGWTPGAVSGRQALEVYPAATLLSRGLSTAGYKRDDATDRRAEIVDALTAPDADPRLVLDISVREACIETDHVLDAVLCCLAAADYARGDVLTPETAGVAPETVRREGWIWFRPPQGRATPGPPSPA